MKYYIIKKFQQDVKSKKGGSCEWHEKLEYEYIFSFANGPDVSQYGLNCCV